MDIGIGNFGYKTGRYYIDVYGVLGDGSMVLLGGIREEIGE